MQEVELTMEKMVFEGKALARQDRFVVFVDDALPGEKVIATIYKKKKQFAHARVKEILVPSPDRQPPACPMFGTCGGCVFQHYAYPAQLQMKRDVLIESLHGLPGIPELVRDIAGAGEPFYFRNKMGFAFGLRDGAPVLGLHRRGDWRTVVPTDMCLLESPQSVEIMKRTMAFATSKGIAVYDERKREGILRHLVVREGKNTGERMVHLHVAAEHPALEELPAALGDLCTTFVLSAHMKVPEAAPPESTRVLTGHGFIREKVNGFVFEIGPSTFFQTNTKQAEKLFGFLNAWAAEIHPRKAVDLYAGTGPIAIHLSAIAEHVIGIESNAESVQMAKRNIELNNLANVEMVCTEAEKTTPDLFPNPVDLVVVDPPRPGLHKDAVATLLQVAPPNLIYVSCNPATLARDLKMFVDGGYQLEAVQPVDMFPHTFHIETIAKLKR